MEYSTNTMVTPYDPSNTITNIFIQIEKGVKIDNAENTPFTNEQTIAKEYLLVHKIGPYSE